MARRIKLPRSCFGQEAINLVFILCFNAIQREALNLQNSFVSIFLLDLARLVGALIIETTKGECGCVAMDCDFADEEQLSYVINIW